VSKEQNRKIVESFLTCQYWLPEYADMFAEDFSIDFPNAPPGMPQHMDNYDARLFKEWLNRTVKTWKVNLEELYSTADPDLFWAVWVAGGDVFWGGKNGKFQSKMIARIQLENGKIKYMRELFDPLKFLEAIGAEVPIFHMDLYDKRVDQLMGEQAQGKPPDKKPEADIDMSPEAVNKRIQKGLYLFTHVTSDNPAAMEEYYAPGIQHRVWFLPPEMKGNYPDEIMPRVMAWINLSCPTVALDDKSTFYPTDDPCIYFAELRGSGATNWIGNNCAGHYRNRYFFIFRFDAAGRIKGVEEFLNPINKFNSINTSLPSFPYFF
jgi:ketosteroid isomerase-like protein